MSDLKHSSVFFANFAGYLKAAGYSPEQSRRFMWKPHQISDLNMLGGNRDQDFSKLALQENQLEQVHADHKPEHSLVDRDFYRKHKIILVLVPGFTHETLKNLSLHEEMERSDSPHHVLMLQPGESSGGTRETVFNEGDGFKFVYAKYPRSNAASQHIAQPFFELLHNSKTLRRWVEEDGYRLFFMGYSYGCPLSLELFANLNTGRFKDDFLLKNTLGFLAMCGAIGGSYLADDVMKPTSKLVFIPKLVALCRKYPLLSKIVGLPTRQFQDDMEDGVRSLTREERQIRMAQYAQELPPHLKYFSIAAVMPMQDYKRRWWHFNLDDYTMYLQARVSEPVSVYNDGQVVMADNLIPRPAHIPESHFYHLGAVRAHHWAVSYKTFNFGWNQFPRRPFYKALIHTIFELGLKDQS